MSVAPLSDRIKGIDLVAMLIKAILSWNAHVAQTLIEFPEASADAEEAVRTWASRLLTGALQLCIPSFEMTVYSSHYAESWLRQRGQIHDDQKVCVEHFRLASCAGKITVIALNDKHHSFMLFVHAIRSKKDRNKIEWHWDLWNVATFSIVCSHSSPGTDAFAQKVSRYINGL